MMFTFVITLCVSVHLFVCVLDGEKAVLRLGSDPDGLVHIDVGGSHHCHSFVFY